MRPLSIESAGSAPSPFDKSRVEEEVFLRILDELIGALEDGRIWYVLVGGVASSVHGRPRHTLDIDILVRPHDARRVLSQLSAHGFATDETDPQWLYKAKKEGVVIDVLFESSGGIYLDDEMRERARVADFMGRPIRVAAPEDILVMKVSAHKEDTPRYWFDALGIVAYSDLDWDYLLRRALRHGARRVLSALIYAQSNDIPVPNTVIRRLLDEIYES